MVDFYENCSTYMQQENPKRQLSVNISTTNIKNQYLFVILHRHILVKVFSFSLSQFAHGTLNKWSIEGRGEQGAEEGMVT
jgi:hypothetical protein